MGDGGQIDKSNLLLWINAIAPKSVPLPSRVRALSLLQFAKSVVIWCQRLIQAEGGKGGQKTAATELLL